MGYLIFLLTLGIIVGVIILFSKQQNNLAKRQKITLALCFVLLIALIAIYNLWQDKTDESNAALQSAYTQNKPITCEFKEQSYIITKQSFNFSGGTMSFLGKPDSEFNGLIIPLQFCHITPQDKPKDQSPQSLTAQDILSESSPNASDSSPTQSPIQNHISH